MSKKNREFKEKAENLGAESIVCEPSSVEVTIDGQRIDVDVKSMNYKPPTPREEPKWRERPATRPIPLELSPAEVERRRQSLRVQEDERARAMQDEERSRRGTIAPAPVGRRELPRGSYDPYQGVTGAIRSERAKERRDA